MTTNEMQKKLDELKESIDKALAEVTKYEELIRQIKAQEEPKFERRKGREYFMVEEHNGKAECYRMEDNIPSDQLWYDNNNYFYTEERAQEVADKINFLLKLERLYDTYCPDYVPDWFDAETAKWYVFLITRQKGMMQSAYLGGRRPKRMCISRQKKSRRKCAIFLTRSVKRMTDKEYAEQLKKYCLLPKLC